MELQHAIYAARILVVDDQQVNVKLLDKLLRMSGFSHVECVTDPTLVETLHGQDPYDLILLDIRMPQMDGFEVMSRIRSLSSDGDYLPVLVMTAQTDQETRLHALELGARDYLTKPFDRVEALHRICNMLEVRMLHKQARDQNRILEQRVRERTEELQNTQLEVVRRLGMASEYKDNETGLHIVRMSQYAEAIAREAGMSPGECELLLNASPMHDIGKLGIPDGILQKPGKLDDAEWAKMRQHAEIGAHLLEGGESEVMETARIIALTHHERWDGSGYPTGLQGEEIPVFGRICAIADVFDALTSTRPYKAAWPQEKAVEEIVTMSGTHYDPELVQAFVRALPRIRQIAKGFADEPVSHTEA
ncbi:response regulator [Magnetofaba australis]|uniref:Putative response regulator receiver modulated metal dependent phosphohydrolase n=1 Tax=Magnetofaba australis IT-1 TaxID=1434232 RepID=A0A1Y2K8I6_9PROT|nr:two-component system response regulator [Magnetofaba australis]OSM04986.1 putative response regulator receiver modulated metal dependent phosphohydrolase [Magnetofaba australis IT-1]